MDKSSITVLALGILLLIIGFAIRYFVGRRRFYRRTIGNMQRFINYNKSLSIPIIEKILMILANIMIIAGIVFVALILIFT